MVLLILVVMGVCMGVLVLLLIEPSELPYRFPTMIYELHLTMNFMLSMTGICRGLTSRLAMQRLLKAIHESIIAVASQRNFFLTYNNVLIIHRFHV
jgi:hypothetical protein